MGRVPVSNSKTTEIPLALPSLQAMALAHFVKRVDFEMVARFASVTVVSDGESEADLIWLALIALRNALAEAVHTIGRVGPLSGDPYRLAGQLGMPPWRVQKAQKQARRWSRDTVATAMKVVATLNASDPHGK